jgi:exodeoxyribonuclease-3
MRLVTWNVNSMSARIDFVLDFLASSSPDVVCVQELKMTDEAFPHLAFEQAGYRAVTHGQNQWNGVGVLVRRGFCGAPELVHRGLPGLEAMGARLVTAKVGELSVTSVYVPNGKSLDHPDFPSKVAWLDGLVRFASSSLDAGASTIVAGDFNLCPTDLDSWNAELFRGDIFHTEAERIPFRKLEALGYEDLFRKANPDVEGFSWWDYRAGAFHKKQGLRIDLVLGSAALSKRVESARVERDFRKKREGRTPSDHAPVVIELAP